LKRVEAALRKTPAEAGVQGGGVWDGKTLSSFLHEQLGVDLKVRQCQRLFRHLGFRLRKPRPLIAHADPAEQAAYKKTPAPRRRSKR
jgi:transposase